MPSTIEFFSEKAELVGGERRWSRGKMHFDVDSKRWNCEEASGEMIEGKDRSTHHKSAGTYKISDDKSKLRLTVEQHDGDRDNQDRRELEFNLDELRERNFVPGIFTRQELQGDVRRLEDRSL